MSNASYTHKCPLHCPVWVDIDNIVLAEFDNQCVRAHSVCNTCLLYEGEKERSQIKTTQMGTIVTTLSINKAKALSCAFLN